MGVFLNEDEFGRDAALVGFPHVVVCMAFVLRTGNDLWGVHLTDPTASPPILNLFWQWATNKGLQVGQITDMYGCCDHRIRYGQVGLQGVGAWNVEMQGFANQIGWNGPAHGFDTSIIAPVNGTYVEYRLAVGGTQPCQIFYKRNEKTHGTGTTQIAPAGGTADFVAYDVTFNRFRPMAFMVSGVAGNVSRFHKGTFHEVDYALRLNTAMV